MKRSQEVSETLETMSFEESELAVIHAAACRIVSAAVQQSTIDPAELLGPLAKQEIHGVFVTLKRGETLRGCCGLQGPAVRLGQALVDAATRTALHDPRMSPVAPVELPHLTLSISLLGPPRPIGVSGDARIDAISIGEHGLRIRMNARAGLLLPMVATERQWNARQFLDAVCHKAGLPAGSWRHEEAVVEIFDGVGFTQPFDMDAVQAPCEPVCYSQASLRKLQHWITSNVIALRTGATPFYYVDDVSDATVPGVVLTLTEENPGHQTSWMEFSAREGVPLQSTLFNLTKQAAVAFGDAESGQPIRVDLAVLHTVIQHGTDRHYHVDEVDCARRAIIALDGKRWAIGYDVEASAESLCQTVLGSQRFRDEGTSVFSAVCESTSSQFMLSSSPAAASEIDPRPPGVAGLFYPAEDEQRDSMVRSLLKALPEAASQPVAAAMVPHAGLRYSGHIAADVWRRIELPKSVLIISPKHTRDGVDWAVAPHDRWDLSDSASLAGDVELARGLASHVEGMELDATAHRREHGIEVQLPLLYQLAPQTLVAAIAMGGSSVGELRRAAKSLASFLAAMDEPPLLVISSDMNHFADDQENRRRDRLALDALAKLDPELLLHVCQQENISMCGQIPAALVLMTLHELNRALEYREIAYGTSGDISGDRSRVVGYAGVLF